MRRTGADGRQLVVDCSILFPAQLRPVEDDVEFVGPGFEGLAGLTVDGKETKGQMGGMGMALFMSW